MHWHDREPCSFYREKGESFGTYVGSTMCRIAGDDMLKWASNRAYRSRRLQYSTMRSLSAAIRSKYGPEGVKSLNFQEQLDGHQSAMFYYRDLLLVPLVARLLSRPIFANSLYTRFRLVKDHNRIRIIGAYNTGD